MSDQAEIRQYVLFALNRLPAENAHHQFELMCKDLAKGNIIENIIPATGPVARVGDQGRDFLSFKTYLDENLDENTNFLGENSSGDAIVFTCSIQKDVISKIKSDVEKIIEFGLPVDAIYFFSREDVKVANRNQTKKWAYDNHKIYLEIFDGNAIADLLGTPKNHWIAKRYLKVPDSLFSSGKNFQGIQAFFNRISTFIERLNKKEFSINDKTLVNVISDFNASELKHIFGISISQTRRGFDNKIEFLNGKYTLLIEMYLEGIHLGFFKDHSPIALSNPIELAKFYKDLQDFIKLNKGYELKLPEELLNQIKEIRDIYNAFDEITDLIIQLYKTESKSSAYFARKIHKSERIQKLFGISIRNPNRPDGYLADEYFYFIDGQYYIIPNSITLRVQNPQGKYDDVISRNSTTEQILKALKDLFEGIIEYVKKRHKIENLTIDIVDIGQKLSLLEGEQKTREKEQKLEEIDYELLENHINRLKETDFSKDDPFLNRIKIELGKISRNKKIDEANKSIIEKVLIFAKEGIIKKEGEDIELYIDILYLLTFTKESLDLIKVLCFDDLKELYNKGNKTYDLLRILYICGYFGDLKSAFAKAIDEKSSRFLNYLKDQFCLLIYNDDMKKRFLDSRINIINLLYDKKKELNPETNNTDKTIDQIINELIYKYENLK